MLRRGARGDGVLDVQARLGALGYPIERIEHGTYGTLDGTRPFARSSSADS
jgi:hypothetical protein